MSTDTSTADTGTTENYGAPRDNAPPAAEPASVAQGAPEPAAAPEPPEAPADAVSEDQDDDQDDDGGEDAGGKGNREAAKYRRRLRDVEAERDTLKATVAALQRAEVDRLATADDLRPAALWASAELGDLLSDDGTVDEAKVSQAIGAAREQLGIPNPPPRGNYVKGEGRSPGRPPRPSGLDAMVGAVMGRDGRDG
ncbi:hypothetical protein [Mycolicibacterium psychrotolerans]|nr:hypothetical protein [Mycolicibacterium psychrotolerans]